MSLCIRIGEKFGTILDLAYACLEVVHVQVRCHISQAVEIHLEQ